MSTSSLAMSQRGRLVGRVVRIGTLGIALCLVLITCIWSPPGDDYSASPMPASPRRSQALVVSMSAYHDCLLAGKFQEVEEKLVALERELPENVLDWDYGNVFHRFMVLNGLLAVYRDQDLEGARGFLALAGQAPSSPQLSSFGPNMLLAKVLLERGEFDAVEIYLEQCQTMWPSGTHLLQLWKSQVHVHQIPNFGPNLDY